MKLVTLDSLFSVHYGVNLDLNKLEWCENGINYVSRTQKNNGVSARVKELDEIAPNPSGTISVSGGGSVLEAFLQETPYYSGRDLYYLKPRSEMTKQTLLYFCMCIRANKFKYNFGRQPNKTLGSIKVPAVEEIPQFVNDTQIKDLSWYKQKKSLEAVKLADVVKWKEFEITELFDVSKGIYYHKDTFRIGNTPLITSTEANNGTGYMTNLNPMFEGNCITIGKVKMSAFYQPIAFCCSHDVSVLKPKYQEFNQYIAMFIIGILNLERFRYDYGRQIQLNAVKKVTIKLPVDQEGKPNYQYMEEYIKTLSYTKEL